MSIRQLCETIQRILELYSKSQAEKEGLPQVFPCRVKSVRDKLVVKVLVGSLGKSETKS